MKDPINLAPISAIIPCYQAKGKILRAITSIHHQTLRPKEIIIIDDFSNDGTLEYLSNIVKKFPEGWIKIVSLSCNQGPASARNIGWDAATQEYIAFLDSDDTWQREKVEIQYSWMRNNPSVILSAHSCSIFDADRNNTKLTKNDISFFRVKKNNFLYLNPFSTISVMLKRDIAFRFKNGKRFSEDYHLWLDIAFSGVPCYKTETVMAFIHKPPYGVSGLSSNLWQMEKGELDCYWNLYKERKISLSNLSTASSLSIAKFIKRLLLFKFINSKIYK